MDKIIETLALLVKPGQTWIYSTVGIDLAWTVIILGIASSAAFQLYKLLKHWVRLRIKFDEATFDQRITDQRTVFQLEAQVTEKLQALDDKMLRLQELHAASIHNVVRELQVKNSQQMHEIFYTLIEKQKQLEKEIRTLQPSQDQ